ncbi:MAG: PAS domain-containing sensor histidine kinase [Methylotenera sp. 24-45-7]|jgi:nitrogen fixation/metabolism regulation signal transduction histidine kinase|nr:MAG: PAS domain-containing sensor histidine kinase [Methylotenera sp. 24-45-7]OZA51020.1 MAG: PAS domain-containing sensor histidine kinase [Methylophilales bacterium 39-45-7]HQS37404.1 ATP-binding protein [Methylotenera sp.]HQS44138.1 ATP-binding protein [Methylotenera sp.]
MKYIVYISAVSGGFLLYLLSNASAKTAASGEYYSLLVALNIALAIMLVLLIGVQLFSLYRNIRARVMGSRFTLRLLGSFALMAIIPGLIVYMVSVNFLTRSIESWFNVKVESALEGGLNLGRTALDIMLADVKEKGESMATSLAFQPANVHYAMLNDLREKGGIQDATLLTPQGRILSVSSSDSSSFLPELPTVTQLRQARQRIYGNIEPIEGKGLFLRVLVPVSVQDIAGETRILQLLQPVPKSLATTAEAVQDVYQEYQQLSYSRTALKQVFALTLTLVMILAIFTAVAIAFVLSRRLSAPLSVLAEGTRAIASGDYGIILPAHGKDELGVLVQSFNSMTQQLGDARKAADRNRARVEAARGYLETILAHLSSGVLALNERGELRTFNEATVHILGISLEAYVGFTPDMIIAKQAQLANFFQAIALNSQHESGQKMAAKEDVQTQVEIATAKGKQIITVRGTRLPDGGYVAVFDDATAMVQAQRDAAWGEVARRLAHEIKNPLTPIQLSAERMAHKLHDKLEPADAKILQRSTETIVNQVDALKKMVNEFSEYARSPAPHFDQLDLNMLIREVMSLYDLPKIRMQQTLSTAPCVIRGDTTMLRQVLHNLLQNAQDALADKKSALISVSTETIHNMLVLTVQDNGGGFAAEMMQHIFEPYVTSKPHGTGLGLAIVKKIIEEHKGSIKVENTGNAKDDTLGAVVTISIPLLSPVTEV